MLVNLLDVNDNAPKIKVVAFGAETVNDQAVVPVVENMADRNFVAKIVASDDDSGDNGRITCEVDPESSAIRSAFHITRVEAGRNVEYQVATARAFDREQMSEYYFDVRCHDRGNPQLSASLRLTVRVTDTNDNAPKFGTSYYEFFVPEDTPAEKVVGVFDVSDADDGSNGNLHFWLDASVSNLFRMDAGRLVLAGRLDRELCENYTFAVHVSDQGDPPLTSNATVRLRVTDVNDHAPQINATLHVEVPENIPFDSLPHLIYTVRVHDVDAPGTPNSNVSFMLLEDGPFIIDKNGNLFLNALLDRETRASYQFQLLAHDNGQPALTSTCTVSITVTGKSRFERYGKKLLHFLCVHFARLSVYLIHLHYKITVVHTSNFKPCLSYSCEARLMLVFLPKQTVTVAFCAIHLESAALFGSVYYTQWKCGWRELKAKADLQA